MFWRIFWSSGGIDATHDRDQALLLRDVELRRRSGLEPLLDQRENPAGGAEIVARHPQPILRRQHLEIGRGDS